jgi:hypothetical protein
VLAECARIHARDFYRRDALTITSVLPGIEFDYPIPGAGAQ